MDHRQAATILKEIARSTSDPSWKDALAFAAGHLNDHHHQSSKDNDDDDDESRRLAAKFHIDPATFAKLKTIKGDETNAILRLASRKDNPKGYILTCIKNAERELAEQEKQREAVEKEQREKVNRVRSLIRDHYLIEQNTPKEQRDPRLRDLRHAIHRALDEGGDPVKLSEEYQLERIRIINGAAT